MARSRVTAVIRGQLDAHAARPILLAVRFSVWPFFVQQQAPVALNYGIHAENTGYRIQAHR